MSGATTSESVSIEDQLEWEEYKGDIPFWKHAVAGSCAGVAEHVMMFPLDTAKTRLQAWSDIPAEQRSFSNALKSAYSERGFFGLFRGAGAITSGCIPAHAALFGVYEFMKKAVDLDDEGHHPIKAGLCGASATLCHDAILTPLDVVKQRLQLGCYQSSLDCFQSVVRNEGAAALFRSMPTTLMMNIPFGSIVVAVNESMKELCGIRDSTSPQDPSQNTCQLQNTAATAAVNLRFSNIVSCEAPSSSSTSAARQTKCQACIPPPLPDTPIPVPHPLSSLPLYFLCAGVAGGVAGAATTPFDVIKTRLQTQDCTLNKACCNPAGNPNCGSVAPSLANGALNGSTKQAAKYSGFLSTMTAIFKEEGMRGLYRGSMARVMLQAPATAICWGTYESVKWLLGAKAFGKDPVAK